MANNAMFNAAKNAAGLSIDGTSGNIETDNSIVYQI